jgi:hypothetical protein
VRIGAIYALEQIAKDSEDLHWPVVQILTAYLREHSQEAGCEEEKEEKESVAPGHRARRTPSATADFLAVAHVIRRRRSEWDPLGFVDAWGRVWPEPLDIDHCHLTGADRRGAQLQLLVAQAAFASCAPDDWSVGT